HYYINYELIRQVRSGVTIFRNELFPMFCLVIENEGDKACLTRTPFSLARHEVYLDVEIRDHIEYASRKGFNLFNYDEEDEPVAPSTHEWWGKGFENIDPTDVTCEYVLDD
ncbi:hypothetical protein PFISCL1PPCAC_7295, partial [Pristionchus fissidentatus]